MSFLSNDLIVFYTQDLYFSSMTYSYVANSVVPPVLTNPCPH